MKKVTYEPLDVNERPNPGEYTPRERLLRLLRHEKVDRLPISPIGLSPYTWQTDFPVYHPVLKVAEKHCEFMCKFGITEGVNLCKPEALDIKTEKKEEGERETRETTIKTPKGELTSVRIRDRSIGSWATAKALVNNEEELDKQESLPFEPLDVNLDGLEGFDAKIGDAGLPYCTGIRTPLLIATWGMSEEYRTIFCFTEQERLRKMVDRSHERVMAHITRLLDAGAGPSFRYYSIEDFVEPMMPPSFVDEFIVPYDREIVKLIHDRGRYVVMHCHGHLKAQIERMVKIGVDGVDCAECPPQNDIALAEMLEKAAGKLFLWGYIQFEDLARKSGDEIEEAVCKAVETGGTEGDYVLSQAASPWSAEISKRTQENWIRMIEAGVKFGGH